jgi:hypothetical protein
LISLKKTKDIDQSKYERLRNSRSLARDALGLYLNSISISDMDSVRTLLGTLSLLSSQTDEIARNFAVIFSELIRFYLSYYAHNPKFNN